MELVEVEVNESKHSINKNCLKEFFIEKFTTYSRKFKLINHAPNTNDIQSIWFSNCTLVEFPHPQILLDLVKNLTSLSVTRCNLTKITGDDLRGLGSLKELYLSFNSIETLPKGLFVQTPNLEIVSFRRNRIKEIDENILDPLEQLKLFNLLDNLRINVKFDSINNEGNVTLPQLKAEIKKCWPTEEIIKGLIKQLAETRTEVAELKTNCAKLTSELDQLKGTNFKPFNFTVVVNGKDFEVSKDVLTANSPVLAKLIGENHDADRLVLKDVSGETFEEILNFMMTKNPPREAANLIELYAASARLEMKDLMELTAEILIERVTPENALDVMNVCKKYNHQELSKKALSELNKKFADSIRQKIMNILK